LKRWLLTTDRAIWRIWKEGDVLKGSTCKYYKDDGSAVAEERRYFYIVDGGYNIWIELIAPLNMSPIVQGC
jgi:hypothetical protein